ncbi:MAG: hypothetical protein P4L99_08010 [Chthoniobacter sp.]|nr:hypothetical protein [Chthoniobacter sp.]
MSVAPTAATSQPLAWRITALGILAILAGAMVLLVPRHEPWFDEAQAWLLARDASCGDIIWKYARYEGSPSFWHLLLAIPAKAGAPPVMLNAISSALALAGAAVLLFKSPFPRQLRALLPAGFYFFYQYGIVARSYALLVPLLWLVAVVYPRRFEHPWRYVGLLLLLSHVSLHASWMAGVLMAFFAWEAWRREKWPLARWGVPALVFAANTAFLIAQLRPPADLYVVATGAASERVVQVVQEMWLDSIVPWLWLAAVVLLCALCFFYTRGVLLSYLLMTGGLLALFAFRFFSVWHQGMLFALLIWHAWIAWVSPVRRPLASTSSETWQRLASMALTVTAVVHVWWAVMAGWHDYQFPYSGSREAAQYLREHGLDRERIHAFKFSTCAVLLYLDRNPFANIAPFMPGAFWVWKQTAFATQSPAEIVKGDPPWILVGAQLSPAVEPDPWPQLPGYAMERAFLGRSIWKDDYYRTDSYYLYRRVAP